MEATDYSIKKIALRSKLFINTYYRMMYWYISRFDKKDRVTFMNYGYSNCKKTDLLEEEETNRYQIQLYDYLASQIDIKDCDALEIGSGRGGGAEYITRSYLPKAYIGLDLCKKAVSFCNRYHTNSRLSFVSGNALDLKFSDSQFDVVINVESSHRYFNTTKFLSEVYRVLRPGGHFLYTDFRMLRAGLNLLESMDELDDQINNSNFTVKKKEIITPNILKALDLDHDRNLKMVHYMLPRFMNAWAEDFARDIAAIEGSPQYDWFKDGFCEYYFYCLQKT